MKKRTVLCTALAASMLCAAPVSLHWPAGTSPTVAVDSAKARLGRPLTPMSVAVHRRAYRSYHYGNPYAY
jgi:hypothetical protein